MIDVLCFYCMYLLNTLEIHRYRQYEHKTRYNLKKNKQNALNSILLYFLFYDDSYMFRQKKCHPQGATMFLSEPLQRQYGRRQVIRRETEPTYRHAI
jgi:hypothetical protein